MNSLMQDVDWFCFRAWTGEGPVANKLIQSVKKKNLFENGQKKPENWNVNKWRVK